MKISVVIPVYNKKPTILRALNSVFRQTLQPEEIIVINDGSTDGSELILNELNHPLVKLVNQINSGVSSARNKGITEAKSDWVAFLDADDEWLPKYLETITSLFTKFPDSSVLATSYFLQDYNGSLGTIRLKKLPFRYENGVLSNYFVVSSCSNPPLCSSAITVKKSALKAIGGFPVDITSGEDLLTWAKLAVRFQIAYSTRPLSVFIQDEKRVERLPQIPDFVSTELEKIKKNENPIYIKQYISVWHKMRAKSYLVLGEKKHGFKEIIKSINSNIFTRAWYFMPFVLVNATFFLLAFERYNKLKEP